MSTATPARGQMSTTTDPAEVARIMLSSDTAVSLYEQGRMAWHAGYGRHLLWLDTDQAEFDRGYRAAMDENTPPRAAAAAGSERSA